MAYGLAVGAVAVLPLLQAQAQQLGINEQPIHDAARLGSGAQVRLLLAQNPAMRDLRGGLGLTPLHLAATNPDVGPLKVLLAAGANVNARDEDGATPLHMAAYTNKPEHTKLLLEAGADVNAKTNAGRSVLSMARKMRADEVAGLVSLWILKGCKPGSHCEQPATTDLGRLVDEGR